MSHTRYLSHEEARLLATAEARVAKDKRLRGLAEALKGGDGRKPWES